MATGGPGGTDRKHCPNRERPASGLAAPAVYGFSFGVANSQVIE
jgi:hypothetical protein